MLTWVETRGGPKTDYINWSLRVESLDEMQDALSAFVVKLCQFAETQWAGERWDAMLVFVEPENGRIYGFPTALGADTKRRGDVELVVPTLEEEYYALPDAGEDAEAFDAAFGAIVERTLGQLRDAASRPEPANAIGQLRAISPFQVLAIRDENLREPLPLNI
jgi:hypothetical protein